MGDAFVGLVHPCKIYNILELGIPFMYIGPDRGHIVDLASGLSSKYLSHAVRHGDVDWVVESIKTAARSGTVRCPDAAAVASNRFSSYTLMPEMAETLRSATDSGPCAAERADSIAHERA